MENTVPKRRGTIVSLSICLLCVGLIFFNVACPTPPPPPPGCTSDDDCPAGQVCNTTTGQCEPAPGCTSDDDCEEGQFCDTQTGECVVNEDQYKNALDDFPHDLAAGGHFSQNCSACHHSEPNASGKGCLDCHDRDEALFSEEFDTVVPVLKDAMHNPDRGCRYCHDDETEDGLWDCSKCHLGS
ncbi:MAG: cytochrome c3 family protein [Phycisphaerae bacterium]